MTESNADIRNNQVPDYKDLQNHIDLMIGKFGLHSTIFLLNSFIESTNISVDENHRYQMLCQYLIGECIKVWGLNEKLFFTSNIQEYRLARRIFYHLLRKYTGKSHAKIAEELGLTKRNILYNCSKCEEMLSVPFYYQSFIEKYDALEKCIIHFISKLNTET